MTLSRSAVLCGYLAMKRELTYWNFQGDLKKVRMLRQHLIEFKQELEIEEAEQ